MSARVPLWLCIVLPILTSHAAPGKLTIEAERFTLVEGAVRETAFAKDASGGAYVLLPRGPMKLDQPIKAHMALDFDAPKGITLINVRYRIENRGSDSFYWRMDDGEWSLFPMRAGKYGVWTWDRVKLTPKGKRRQERFLSVLAPFMKGATPPKVELCDGAAGLRVVDGDREYCVAHASQDGALAAEPLTGKGERAWMCQRGGKVVAFALHNGTQLSCAGRPISACDAPVTLGGRAPDRRGEGQDPSAAVGWLGRSAGSARRPGGTEHTVRTLARSSPQCAPRVGPEATRPVDAIL